MKNNIAIILLLVIISNLFVFESKAQDWEWNWVRNTNDSAVGPVLNILHADKNNNYYFHSSYSTDIIFPDTSFTHIGDYSINCVIAQYNKDGQFLKAIDIYTFPNNGIYDVDMVTDKDMNMYITGSFSQRLFFQNTYLNHGNTPYPESPDVFLIKLNKNFELVWADVISGTNQDGLDGIFISDNDDIYMATTHVAGYQSSTSVTYLNQETSVFNSNCVSVMKIDTDKNIQWRKDVIGTSFNYLTMDNNNNVHLFGSPRNDIIIGVDTLYNPNHAYNGLYSYVVSFNSAGETLKMHSFSKGMYNLDIKVDDEGNYFVAGSVVDTMVINQDTIIVPENYRKQYIVKYDENFDILWYRIYEYKESNHSSVFKMQILNDHILFSLTTKNDFQFCDSIIDISWHPTHIIGEINSNGTLINYTTIFSSIEMSNYVTFIDNCSNPILGFRFRGRLYFPMDTISSYQSSEFDGAIAKLLLKTYEPLNLGADTTIKGNDTIILTVPDDYDSYLWSDGSNSYDIEIIGNDYGLGVFPIWLTVSQGACNSSDTIKLIVEEGSSIANVKLEKVHIYPNPAQHELIIEFKDEISEVYHVTLFDIYGNKILFFNTQNKKILMDIENLKAGNYLLNVKNNTGDLILTRKIIKY